MINAGSGIWSTWGVWQLRLTRGLATWSTWTRVSLLTMDLATWFHWNRDSLSKRLICNEGCCDLSGNSKSLKSGSTFNDVYFRRDYFWRDLPSMADLGTCTGIYFQRDIFLKTYLLLSSGVYMLFLLSLWLWSHLQIFMSLVSSVDTHAYLSCFGLYDIYIHLCRSLSRLWISMYLSTLVFGWPN